jgi:hypothetical protein
LGSEKKRKPKLIFLDVQKKLYGNSNAEIIVIKFDLLRLELIRLQPELEQRMGAGRYQTQWLK